MRVTAVIPAFNEAENIGLVVRGLVSLVDDQGQPLIAEVIVADNNSTDATSSIALEAGASVIFVSAKGYGNACFQACKIATGNTLLFVDGDHTADLSQVKDILQALKKGATLAIGARTHATSGSLTLPQRFGNWFACFLIRLIWHKPVTDLGPLRAIDRASYELIAMQDRAFGWTIEMQIRAIQLDLKTVEIPVKWFPRYAGKSKVSGTVSGVIGAGWGILSMIAKLKWQEIWQILMPIKTTIKTPVQSIVSSVKTSPKET
jgi:glycosyltransferase involved in cell wall biosynthesis